MNTKPIDLSKDKVNPEKPTTNTSGKIDVTKAFANYDGKERKKLAIANEKAAKERAKNTPDPRRTRYTTANTENLVSKQYLDPRYEKIRKDVDLFGSMKDLDKIAYANQSGGEVIKNTIAGFGMNVLAGALDSFGANDPVGMAAMLAEDATYQHENWFNRQAKELQKVVGDKFTVFQSENGSMWNSAYWASQLQNLGYSTGLIGETFLEQIALGALTGGTGNVAGAANTVSKVGKLGKAFKMAKSSMANMSKFQRGFGAAQGFKQSYMNAIGAGESTYQQYKKLGYDDDVAKQKAAEASALNFKLQAIPLMLLNGFQYQAVAGKYNPFKGGKQQAQTGYGSVFESFAERTFPNITNKYLKGTTNYLVQMVSEAFEEGLETSMSKYAEFHTLEKDKLNKEPNFISHLTKGHELRDSMIGGALGGAMFKAMGSAFSTRFSEVRAKREDAKRYSEFLSSVSARNYADLKAMSKIDPNDKAALNKHKREMSKASLFEALQYDFLNQDEQAFNSHVNNLQEIQKAIQKKDLDYLQNVVGIENDAELDFLANNVDLLLEEAQETRSDFIKYHKKFKNDWQSAFQASHAESVVRDIERESGDIQSNLEDFRNSDKHYQALSEQGKRYYELMNQNTAMIISSDKTQNNGNIAERTSVLNEMEKLKADKDWKNKSSELASMSLIDRGTHLSLKVKEQHNEKMLGLAKDKLIKWSDSKFREEHKIKQAKEAVKKAQSVAEVEAAAEVLPDNEVVKEKVAKAKVKAKKKEKQTKKKVEKGVPLKEQAPEEQGQSMPEFNIQEEVSPEYINIQEEKATANPELKKSNKELQELANTLNEDVANINIPNVKFKGVKLEVKETRGTQDILEFLESIGMVEDFKFLLPFLKKSKIGVVKFESDNKYKFASLGTRIENGKTISLVLNLNTRVFNNLRTREEQVSVIAHELVHSIISFKLNEQSDITGTTFYKGLQEIYKDINLLYKNAKTGKNPEFAAKILDNFTREEFQEIGQMLDYIKGSVEELATLGTTSSLFIRFLKIIDGKDSNKDKNIWRKFLELVSDFTGISNTKLGELLDLLSTELKTSDLLKQNTKVSDYDIAINTGVVSDKLAKEIAERISTGKATPQDMEVKSADADKKKGENKIEKILQEKIKNNEVVDKKAEIAKIEAERQAELNTSFKKLRNKSKITVVFKDNSEDTLNLVINEIDENNSILLGSGNLAELKTIKNFKLNGEVVLDFETINAKYDAKIAELKKRENTNKPKLTTEPVVKKEEVKEKKSFWDDYDELPLQTKSLSEEELNNLKRTVRGFYSGMKTKYGYAPTFQEIIEELIIMNDKDFADKMFHTMRIGWEANNFTPPNDYTEVYDDIFNGGSLNSINKNLITLSTQILTEEEVEEYSDNAVKSNDKENKVIKQLPNGKEVEVTIDTDLEEMSFNAVFLSIPHKLIQDENGNWSYVYTSNELNTEDDINHQELLGENGVQVGDELFLRVPDNALSLSINKFNENGIPTDSETFGQYLTRNNIEEGSDAYYERVPMMAYNKDGKPVFMIREQEWFNEFNVKGEDAADIQAQIELGRKEINTLRRNVGKNDSLSITITDKSLGTIPKVVPTEKNNQSTTRPISTKPESIVTFVNSSGNFVTGDTIINSNEVDKHEGKEFAEGAYLELIKKPDGRYKAMYLKPQTIGENKNILNMIHGLIYQYTAFDKGGKKSINKLLANLTKGWFPQGIQNLISKPDVLHDFLRNFIQLGNSKGIVFDEKSIPGYEDVKSLKAKEAQYYRNNKKKYERSDAEKQKVAAFYMEKRKAVNDQAVALFGDMVKNKKKDIIFSFNGKFHIVYRKLVNGKYEAVSRAIGNRKKYPENSGYVMVDGKKTIMQGATFVDRNTMIGLDEFMELVKEMEFNPSEKMLANMDSPMITLGSDNSFTNLDESGNMITMRDVLGESMHSEFNSFQLGNETINFVQPRISFSVSKTQSQKNTEEVVKKIEDNKKEKVSEKLNQPIEESLTDTSTIVVIEKTEEVVNKEVEGKPLSVDEVKISDTDVASAVREEVIENTSIENVEKMINDLHQSMVSTTVIDSEHAIEGLSIEQTLDLKQYILNGFAEYISDEDALTKEELREFVEEDFDIIINSKEDEIKALEDRLEEAEDTETLTTKINELKEVINSVRKGKKELVDKSEATFYDLLDITKVNKDEIIDTDNDIGEDRIFDKGAVEMNPKSKSSAKLKRFMFGIQDRLGDKTKKGFLGVTKYKTFDEVYDSVIMTLNQPEGLISSIDELLLKLEEKGKTDPTIKQVYDKLKDKDDATKNMFGYEMTKHTLKMQFLSYKKVGDDYELKVFDTNANDILKVIRNHFESELEVSGLIELDKNNKRSINKAKAKELQIIAERIFDRMAGIKSGKITVPAIPQEGYTKEGVKIYDVTELLNGFGLRLSPESLNQLLNKGWYFDGINGSTKQEFKNMFSDVGVFGYLTKWLQSVEKRDTLTVFDDSHENHPFSDMSGILKGLVALENKYNTYPSPSVFRDAGKSVYGITATTVATDTAQKLTHEGAYGEEYRNMLNSKGFNKTSYMLEMLSQENSALRDKFEVNHLGLIALKQRNSDLFGDAGITDLSMIDHDYTKLGLFQDMKQGKIKPLIKNLPMRMATLFFPNMSDKTQMMIIKTAVFDITDKVVEVKEGKVIPTEEMLEMAYRTLVESELQRMLEFKANGSKTDIKFYDEGASMFLMFPELNKLEHKGRSFADWLFNSDINVDKKFFEDNFKEQAIDSIEGLIDQEFTKTLNSFMDNGYISKDKNGTITTKLDKEYLKSRSSDSNKALNIAAMDFAFNSLLTNANVFQLFSGDPALYAKGASKFFVEKGVLKDEFKDDPKIYDKISMAADGNMDKRLALLIAPGSKIANSVGEFYDQIMLQDWVSITDNVPFLVELYYGTEEVKAAKGLLNAYETADNVDRKKAALKELEKTYPKISDYFEIEGADAQEYTTAEEHLDILHRQGRVSQKVYEKAKQKIRNQILAERAGKEISQKDILSHAELKLMMQPIKPVYAGMINDIRNQVARMMYVKSSSFPLLPQLTKGKELNKIRKLLEDRAYTESPDGKLQYKGVRASYQTANKVGATTNALSIFNPDNTVREVSQLEIDKATVVLDRNNFRIQMDVPMKSLKKNEDKVSHATQPLKLIMGDGIAQLKTDLFDGPKLKKEFDAVYEEYIDTIIQDLYDEVGLPSDGVIKTQEDWERVLTNLQELLITEAKDRGFAQNSIDGLQLRKRKNKLGETVIDFEVPLWLSPDSNRFESLMNAIVNNRINKIKLPGSSYVAASEAGMKMIDYDSYFERGVVEGTQKQAPTEVKSDELPESSVNLTQGDYVTYKGKEYLLWKINDDGGARLVDSEGNKFSGTPNIERVTKSGKSLPIVIYNNVKYAIDSNDNIISLSSGRIANYSGKQKQAILDLARESNFPKAESVKTEITSNKTGKTELFPGVYANEGQEIALKEMKEFLNSDETFFTLTGRGGTGKTTIIKHALKGRSVLFIAPTHKAKSVLSKASGQDAITLASALFVKPNDNGVFAPDAYKRDKLGHTMPIRNASTIVIDEASMISDEYLKDLKEQIRRYNPNAKIIFMGDSAQLAPVGQDTDSKVFEENIGANLSERMRQDENSPIVPLSDIVAENVHSNKPITKVIEEKDRVSKFNEVTNEGVLFLKDEKKVLEEFVNDFKDNPESTRLITFNNESHPSSQSVGNLNRKVRELLYGKNAPQFVVGEQIMSYGTLMKEDAVALENSVEFTVVSVGKESTQTQSFYNKSGSFSVSYPAIEVEVQDNITREKQVLYLPTEQGKKDIKEQLSKITNKQARYFGLPSLIPNLQYSYAVTSHKAQGSTYRNAYVMEDNILGAGYSTPKQKNQSLYVGISRASHKLIMLSNSNKPLDKNNVEKLEPSSERKLTEEPIAEGIQTEEKQVIEENVPQQETIKEPTQEVTKEDVLNGKPYTTNTGVKTKLKDNPSKKSTDHVIYTDAWEGELKAAEFYKDKNGKVVGLKKAQVMVGPKFRDNNGKLIELIFADGTPNPMYVEEKGGKMMLKDSVSKDLLSITSFRIPTSSHQSMTQLEIVGILPFESGDIMIVPRNLTTQKGLDFDVDKETTYQLRHEIDSNGNIRPIDDIYSLEEINNKLAGNLKLKDRKKLRKLKKKLLENKLVRVYDKVLSSPEPQVQERINKVLSMDVANSQASMIDRLISDSNEMFTLASPSHQRNKMEAGSSGKLGIGVYSNMVTFHSMVQQSSYKDEKLGMIRIRKSYTEGEGRDKIYIQEDDPIVFGGVESDGVLGKKDTLVNSSLPKAVRDKIQRGNTDVLAERQNIATDNVKEQVMGRVNINATTINVDALLVALGIDMDAWVLEESELKDGKPIDKQNTIKVGDKYYRKGNIPFLFLSQPILRKYVKGLSDLGSQTKDFVANAKEEFIENLRREYALQVEPNSNPELSGKSLYNNLINPDGATQLAVLDMFLKLDEKADSIRTLQSQLNANRGLGKSRLEASDKYDGLGNIIGRYKPQEGVYLEGYEALFGKVERPKKDDTDRKQELRDEGYKEFNGVFIKPTNPMSKMIVESAAVSQELWSRFFIYDNPTIKDYFKDLLNDSKTNPESDYAVTEFKIKLLKEIKKFFNSNPKNNITTKNANTKRRELFMDSEGNESLAKYLLTHIKDIPALKENKLLGRFTYKLGEEGSPSLIKFNNAVGEGFDDSLLYASLSILENQKDNIVLPNRNGSEYTVDMLIDDLVQYALLEGGVQEAIQFIKYIPIELLKRKGYSEYFSIMEAKDFAEDLENFKVQFFQNNPKLLPKIQPKELVDNKDGTFSIKDLASLGGREDFMVSMYDKKIKAPKQKYRVFKKSGDNYVEVPVLGTFGMSEYSPNMEGYGETILEAKAKKKVKPVVKVRPQTSKKEVTRKYTEEVRVLSGFLENGKTLGDYLEHISDYDDLPVGSTEFALILAPYMKNIETNLSTKLVAAGRFQGSVEGRKGNILIRKKAPVNHLDNTRDYLIKTLLHEGTHAVSSDYLNSQFEEDGITLRKDASQEAKDLKALYEEAIESRSKGTNFRQELKDYKEALKKYRKERNEGKKGAVNPNTSEKLDKFYPFLNVKEFVAEMFTKESFRNEMDNVKSNVVIEGVSNLQAFVDIIRRILGKAGFNYLRKANLEPGNIAANTFLVSAKIFEEDKILKDNWFPEEKKTAYDKKDNDTDIEDILGKINYEENKSDTVFINEAMAMGQPNVSFNENEADSLESSLDFIVARGIENGTFPLTTSTIQQVINGDKSMTIRQIGKEGLNRPGIYPFEFNGETKYFYISQVAYDKDKGRTLEGYTSLNKGLSQESVIESFNVPLEDIGDSSVKKFLEGNNRVQKNLFKITDITKEYTERKAAETAINCK